MRLGIKGKQVLGVTIIVGAVVVVLSLMHLARLAQVSLDESRARAELLANAIYHRAREVVTDTGDPYQLLRTDPGLRSILEASLYDNNVTFAAIVDEQGTAVAHADPSQEGHAVPQAADLGELLTRSSFRQLTTIYRDQGRNFDFTQPLLLDDRPIGSIHIGVSTLLIRRGLNLSLRPAIVTALLALGVAVFGATVLSQLLLRPIHVIRSGLTRLGKGETDVRLDLGQADEFGELGTFFNTVSAQIAADRSQMAGQVAHLESAVEHLEDAVAIVGPGGRVLFANPAMRALVPSVAVGVTLDALVALDHPLRRMAEDTLSTRQSRGPTSASFGDPRGDPGERLLLAHPVNDASGDLVGVMLIARNVEYLSQVESTIRYSRKLAALGRLSAGVAHEVKNPLNAMMIHLELLRQYVAPSVLASARDARRGPLGIDTASPGGPPPEALEHVDVIAREIRRLDEVVQGFLKFTRPEDLKLQPVNLADLINEVVPIVAPRSRAPPRPHRRRGQCGARGQRRSADAEAGHPQPGVERLPGHARGRNAAPSCVSPYGEGARKSRWPIPVWASGRNTFSGFSTCTSRRRRAAAESGSRWSTVRCKCTMARLKVQSTPGKGTTFTILLPRIASKDA